MNALASVNQREPTERKTRHYAEGNQPSILTDIYQENINKVIWQRNIDSELSLAVDAVLSAPSPIKASLVVSPSNCLSSLSSVLHGSNIKALCDDIAELVDMFCFLFELKHVGLRLTALNHAMCPRFHVDKVPCRLVTTYRGVATEWLAYDVVDRSKLGAGNQGKPDEESGLYRGLDDIRRLNEGDVALLKGELWNGNENAGLVHRSPKQEESEQRLLLTLDFITD